MQEMEMAVFEVMECVIDALTDGVRLSDPSFMDVAKRYSPESDWPMLERLVKALRQEFAAN